MAFIAFGCQEMLMSGAFTPQQLAIIQSVYRDIVSQTWFENSLEKQQQLAHFVIEAYRKGITEPEDLRTFCMTAGVVRSIHASLELPKKSEGFVEQTVALDPGYHSNSPLSHD